MVEDSKPTIRCLKCNKPHNSERSTTIKYCHCVTMIIQLIIVDDESGSVYHEYRREI